MQKSGRSAGKTAFMTGGATGMGRATARAFAQEGATGPIFDMDETEGPKTFRMIVDQG